MVTWEGLALIAELVAAAAFAVALAGLAMRHTKPWLIGSVMAFAALIVVVMFIVDTST